MKKLLKAIREPFAMLDGVQDSPSSNQNGCSPKMSKAQKNYVDDELTPGQLFEHYKNVWGPYRESSNQ